MDRKIRAAIIGTGGISGVHMAGYKALPNVEIAAVCDIDVPKAKAYAEKHGVGCDHVYESYDEMLKKEDIDCVSVCTWNAAHAPATIAALNAGKHVICEKPMALNQVQAQEMLDAAKKNDRILMIGFVRRYGNDCRVVKDFIDSGAVGDIYYAKATYLRRHGCPGGWFGDKRYSGGGPLIDLGVHVIDLSRYLMGNPNPVSAFGATFHKLGNRPHLKSTTKEWAATAQDPRFGFSVEDLATAMVRFDNGAVLSVECSFDLNIKKGVGDVELFGTKAGIKLSPDVEITTEMNDYMVDIAPYGETKLSFEGLFESEMAHFVQCVESDLNGARIECRSPGEDGVTIMKILDAIYESAATGHEALIR